jgi:hypothetical protein
MKLKDLTKTELIRLIEKRFPNIRQSDIVDIRVESLRKKSRKMSAAAIARSEANRQPPGKPFDLAKNKKWWEAQAEFDEAMAINDEIKGLYDSLAKN